MGIMVCPNCKTRVLPKADGTCPSCHALIAEPDPVLVTAAPPATPVVARSGSGKIGGIIRRAWQLMLDHKRLWLLGLFATIGVGGPGLSSILLQVGSLAFLGNFNFTAYQVALNIAYLLGMLVFWVIGTGATIGIVYEIATAIRQPTEPPIPLRALIQKVGVFYPRIVLMILLVWSPYLLLGGIAYAVMIPTLTAWTADIQAGVMPNVGAFGFAWLLSCCTGILSILLAAIDAFSLRSIIVENLGVVSSIKKGWQVIRQNLATILVLGIIIAVVTFAVTFAMQLVMLPVLMFVSMPMAQAARQCAMSGGQPTDMMECLNQANSTPAFWGLQMFFVGFVALVSAIPTVFKSALLTVAYLEFEKGMAKEE